MNCRYANLTLQGVSQDNLVEYLSNLGCKSYVSPTSKGFTVMYDFSFEVTLVDNNNLLNDISYIFGYVKQWVEPSLRDDYREYFKSLNISALLQQRGVFDLTTLSPPESENILNQYLGIPEGNLVCWASHLSNHFSCVVLACYLKDENHFWYHLSKNGAMIDEYTTYADEKWEIGMPILSEDGREIKGGDSKAICATFGREDKAEEVESILRKPYISQSNFPVRLLDYQALLDCDGFQDGVTRHQALNIALDMPYEWTIDMSFEAIVEDTLSNQQFRDKTLLKKSNSDVEANKLSNKSNSEWNKTVTKYCKKLRKAKGIIDCDLDAITTEIESLIQMLNEHGQLEKAKVLNHLAQAILQNQAFNNGGKFSALEYLLVIIEVLIKSINSKIDEIGYLSFIELSKLMDRQFLNHCGQTWKQHKNILAFWLSK